MIHKQVRNKKEQQAPQKGRFLKKVSSAALENLLQIVNAVPKNAKRTREPQVLEAILKDAPSEFRQYVAPNGLNELPDVVEALKRYEEVLMWREAVRSFQYLHKSDFKLSFEYDRRISLDIQCNEQGFIELRGNPFTDAVKEGIDAERVRTCANEKCQRLFWKGRIDQESCSTACAKVVRTRKWRAKAAEYEYNRIKNERKKENK